MVSTGIRRDLIAPLKDFSKFEIIHFYRRAEYGDIVEADVDPNLCQYQSPIDLYRRLLRASPDVVQGVEPFSLSLLPYVWACNLAAKRTDSQLLIVTLENFPLDDKYGRVTAALLRAALRSYFSRAKLFIVLNEGARLNLDACGVGAERVVKLMWGSWGVDLAEFSPAQPANQEGKGNHLPIILFAARLHEEKGIFYLLDAFPDVRATFRDVQMVIAGDGPARAEVERRAAALGDVRLVGIVKHRAMPGLFRGASVLASPSITSHRWKEQVGMTNIQAMACGVPVVSTRSGAIPEYVPDGVAGILVPEQDSAALAGGISNLLLDPGLRTRMGGAARRYAVENYDAKVNIERAESVLLQRLGSGKV